MQTRCQSTFLILLTAIGVSGCRPSGPEIATVEGTVMMDGKPLPYATVVFNPENGRPAGARTDKDGHYVLNFNEDRRGAIPGKNKVMITTATEAAIDEDGNPIPASGEKVPSQYNVASTLEFVVEKGKHNVADFNLESKGEIIQEE